MGDTKKLINRLSRISGQIEAVKRMVEEDPNNCAAVIHQLKAVQGATKNFGKAYVNDQIDECLTNPKKGNKETMEQLLTSLFDY